MIQDADNPDKDTRIGGVNNRLEYLKSLKEEYELEFSTFLFPNNKDDGDLEDILLAIVNEDKYRPFHENYSNYSDRVKSFSLEKHALELMESKYLVFNYCQVYHGAENSKESVRFYRSEYWDLNHDAIKPLTTFLEQEIFE